MRLPALSDELSKFEIFARSETIYAEFIEQLNKDLSRAGTEIRVPDAPQRTLNEIIPEIETAINQSIQKTQLSLHHLLYMIDINEAQAKQVGMTESNPVRAIALLIVKRILQKVIVRKLFGRA